MDGRRIIGLDYGDKTVGVALSDPLGVIAQPLETIRRTEPENLKKTVRRIRELTEVYDVHTLVIGLPLNMNHTEGERAEKARAFGKRLTRDLYETDIVFWDERLSTKAAEIPLIEMKMDRFERKQVVDGMAAALILQGYLDAKKQEETKVTSMEEKIILYEPEEQLKSDMTCYAEIEWHQARYFLASVDMEEDDDEDEEDAIGDEDSESVFIFKYCEAADYEFQILNGDGTIQAYVTTELTEEEEKSVVEAFQALDDDFELEYDEE